MFKILFFINIVILFNTPIDLIKMRYLFSQVDKNEAALNALIALTSQSNDASIPLNKAYFAVAEMTSAKYKTFPTSKLNAFKSGRIKLDQALAMDSKNIEIRYLRYTIQTNAPSFLGYNKEIESDKAFLLENISPLIKSDKQLFDLIYTYLSHSEYLTQAEKLKIKDYVLR